MTAALLARWLGNKVVLLEKAPELGIMYTPDGYMSAQLTHSAGGKCSRSGRSSQSETSTG